MKYIITKDGKIHISYSDYQGFEKLWVCKKRNTLADFYYVRRSNIIKQANTIEELCDEFVFEMGLEHTICQLTFEQVRDNILNCELESMSTLYGAIWTDRGLIYVAKMNDKGELELL